MLNKKTLSMPWKRMVSIFLVGLFIFSNPVGLVFEKPIVHKASADTSYLEDESDGSDYDLYQKYIKYKNYKKRQNYRKYKKYKEKYGFKDEKEKALYKDRYEKYKLYLKDKVRNRQYSKYWEEYKRYRNYKDKYLPYKKYSNLKKYDESKYGRSSYSRYGSKKYERGYNRYKSKLSSEANLGGDSLGPKITVGLWSYTPSSIDADPFTIKANKDYIIKDKDGNNLGTIAAATVTEVNSSDGKLRVHGSIDAVLASKQVTFEAADGNDDDMIFDANKPSSSFDHYRGKIILRDSDGSSDIWVINRLPLEHYIWGMGEITGTGPSEYNNVMTTAYRTYGYWKIKYSTKYAAQGFKVTATSSSQIYYGYDWEKDHTDIRKAAIATRSTIVMYKDRIAITPYSSWTDGRTRSWEDRWGSSDYPWCQSVKDPYGKHPTMSTKELEAAGNHMVGMSAHGALHLADEHDWSWTKILKYYYDDISLKSVY